MQNDKELLGIGFSPAKCVGAYSVPFSGTFDNPVVIPAHVLGVVTSFLNNLTKEDIDEVSVIVSSSAQITIKAFGANLSVAALEQGEYQLQEALSILKGKESRDTVKDPETETQLPSGARFNLGKRGYKILSSLATHLGDVSLIPTAHKASWVMLDSPNTPNWNGAILGNVYPVEYPVDEIAVPLFSEDK